MSHQYLRITILDQSPVTLRADKIESVEWCAPSLTMLRMVSGAVHMTRTDFNKIEDAWQRVLRGLPQWHTPDDTHGDTEL
jgi:uncharacterized protein YlzI (FlbEa/FlbD family)